MCPPATPPHHTQARLPEIEVLQSQLQATQQELTEAGFKLQEQAAAAETRQRQLGEETEVLQLRIDEVSTDKLGVEAALREAEARHEALQAEMEERTQYISSLEGG